MLHANLFSCSFPTTSIRSYSSPLLIARTTSKSRIAVVRALNFDSLLRAIRSEHNLEKMGRTVT